jgi:hypothetical protein
MEWDKFWSTNTRFWDPTAGRYNVSSSHLHDAHTHARAHTHPYSITRNPLGARMHVCSCVWGARSVFCGPPSIRVVVCAVAGHLYGGCGGAGADGRRGTALWGRGSHTGPARQEPRPGRQGTLAHTSTHACRHSPRARTSSLYGTPVLAVSGEACASVMFALLPHGCNSYFGMPLHPFRSRESPR